MTLEKSQSIRLALGPVHRVSPNTDNAIPDIRTAQIRAQQTAIILVDTFLVRVYKLNIEQKTITTTNNHTARPNTD